MLLEVIPKLSAMSNCPQEPLSQGFSVNSQPTELDLFLLPDALD